MGVKSGQVTVGTSATLIVSAGLGDVSLLLYDPQAGADVYIGDSTVTTNTGFLMEGGDTIRMTLRAGEQLYGIVSVGTQLVSTLMTGWKSTGI